MADTVWVVESGEYEQRSVDLVARTLEDAVKALKEGYAKPYEVTWGEVVEERGFTLIRAEFDEVLGYSARHNAVFYFSEYDLEG